MKWWMDKWVSNRWIDLFLGLMSSKIKQAQHCDFVHVRIAHSYTAFCLVIMFPDLFILFMTSTPKFAANGLEHVVTVLWSWQAVSWTFVTMPALKIKGKMGTQKSMCVSGKGMWRVMGEREQRISQEWENSLIWGGPKASCSPDVELLVRLRSSSATQEKLQYPLGTLALVWPSNGSPVKTANPDFISGTQDTHIRTCLWCQCSHWLMILWWVYLGRLLAIGNIKYCSAARNTAEHRRLCCEQMFSPAAQFNPQTTFKYRFYIL